jgi:hypothetical protein
MQFLVYLTVLLVSVSTVLLEVHWLITPPPPQKPAVQAENSPASAPKVEGPNAALSPVYPKKLEAAESAANAQQPAADQQQTQKTLAATEPARSLQAETTGVAGRADNPQAPGMQPAGTVSNNRCDVDACGRAYASFRASDCTYQPFFGERRVCTKAPGAARNARRESTPEPAATRRSTRGIELRDQELERRARLLRDGEEDDDDRFEIRDSERDELFGRGRRW